MLSTTWKKVIRPISRLFMRNIITPATASDYENVMDLVKWKNIHIIMNRSRSIDYYYAGCQIPEVMKVPFFVAVFFISVFFILSMVSIRKQQWLFIDIIFEATEMF